MWCERRKHTVWELNHRNIGRLVTQRRKARKDTQNMGRLNTENISNWLSLVSKKCWPIPVEQYQWMLYCHLALEEDIPEGQKGVWRFMSSYCEPERGNSYVLFPIRLAWIFLSINIATYPVIVWWVRLAMIFLWSSPFQVDPRLALENLRENPWVPE